MEASPGKIAAAPPGGAGGAGDDKSLPDPTGAAKWTLVGLLLASVALAALLNHAGWTTHAFKPAQDATANFALFAGFYVAAQVIERLLEVVSPLLPPWKLPGADEAAKVAHAKADRATIALGLATFCGVGASCAFGLYFLSAVGIGVETTNGATVSTISHGVDAMITGLTIGAGTKPLHDLIGNIQNKNNPKTGNEIS
jgi:hypothetical protein